LGVFPLLNIKGHNDNLNMTVTLVVSLVTAKTTDDKKLDLRHMHTAKDAHDRKLRGGEAFK
jgi:hypothetical protein